MKYAIFPLGYRCSSAGILKQIGHKKESYPFDWCVSRLPIVQHCLETEFKYFIDDISNNYKSYKTATQHYEPDGTTLFICNETVVANTYYSKQPISPIHFTQPLTIPRDTYAFPLVMNHHNIFDENDHAYYCRCISRFNQLLTTPSSIPTMYLYIHPALSESEYERYHPMLMSEFANFQLFLQSKYPETYPRGLLFVPIKTQIPYPITSQKEPVELVINTLDDTSGAQHAVYLVYMNKDFVDAGEIFMRNAYIETDAIIHTVKQYL
jgi:hypothetical protein